MPEVNRQLGFQDNENAKNDRIKLFGLRDVIRTIRTVVLFLFIECDVRQINFRRSWFQVQRTSHIIEQGMAPILRLCAYGNDCKPIKRQETLLFHIWFNPTTFPLWAHAT